MTTKTIVLIHKIISYPECLCGCLCEESLGCDDAGIRIQVEELCSFGRSFTLSLLSEHHRVLFNYKPPVIVCGKQGCSAKTLVTSIDKDSAYIGHDDDELSFYITLHRSIRLVTQNICSFRDFI